MQYPQYVSTGALWGVKVTNRQNIPTKVVRVATVEATDPNDQQTLFNIKAGNGGLLF